MFGIRFVVVVRVEASKGRCQAAKCTYESQLRLGVLNHQPKPGFRDEIEAFLRLGLHLREEDHRRPDNW